MEWNRSSCWRSRSSSLTILFLSLFLLTAISSATAFTFVSEDIFGYHASTGRNILQALNACPVDFESQNYTIITSQCRGPQYPPNLCCAALVEFACPFAAEINDVSNNCANTMFTYITRNGNYPPALFSSVCRQGPQGLACPPSPSPPSRNDSPSPTLFTPSSVLMIVSSLFLMHLLQD